MKNYFKNTLKFAISIFVLSLFFTNCEKEAIQVEEPLVELAPQPTKFSMKRIYKDKIQRNAKLNSRLNLLNTKLKPSFTNKIVAKGDKYIKDYNFTIDTESATYIEEGNYHSYTFPIKQSGDENIKNVLFTLNQENEYDAFLVVYDYSLDDLNVLGKEELSEKTTMIPIDLDMNSLTQRVISFFYVAIRMI